MRRILSLVAAARARYTRRLWVLRFVSAVPTLRWTAAAETVRVTQRSLPLGDSEIHVVSTDGRARGVTFVSVHEDEDTGVAAARKLVQQYGGRLIELRSRRQRLLTFDVQRGRHRVDPNRLFTNVGIEKSLRLNGSYSQAAHDAVVQFRDALVAAIFRPDAGFVIAVHNNAARGLSVERYTRGGSFEREAARVGINPNLDAHDFFLVLRDSLFEKLHAAGFNVVLQSPAATDDGSMSVYCQQRGIEYANVEAGFGHLWEQTRMLDALLHAIHS